MKKKLKVKSTGEKEEGNANSSKEKLHLTMKADDRIDTDPNGSWTGTPKDINEVPIQDVDDL